MCASVSDPRGLIGHDLVRTVVARRSMRVRVRVRLRAVRARACVRASVVRAGPREQARGAKPDADGFRWLAACCTVLQLVVLQRVRE